METQKRNISKAVLLAVVSSHFAAYAFTPNVEADKPGTLTVMFPSKEGKPAGVYQYADVPQATFDALQAAESKGSFLIHNIQGPRGSPLFAYTRLTDEEIAEFITLPVIAEHSADDPGMVGGGINVANTLQDPVQEQERQAA